MKKIILSISTVFALSMQTKSQNLALNSFNEPKQINSIVSVSPQPKPILETEHLGRAGHLLKAGAVTWLSTGVVGSLLWFVGDRVKQPALTYTGMGMTLGGSAAGLVLFIESGRHFKLAAGRQD